MVRHRPRLSDFILTPIKIAVLAALPLVAGIEVGDRATAGDDARGEGITGSVKPFTHDATAAFNTTLSDGYRTLSSTLEQSGHDARASTNDWADAQYFALKGMAADRGENDGPEKISSWTLIAKTRPEVATARDRLMASLGQMPQIKKSANVAAAQDLADAQVKFDCWIERTEEAQRGATGADDCRAEFESALAAFDVATGRDVAASSQPTRQ